MDGRFSNIYPTADAVFLLELPQWIFLDMTDNEQPRAEIPHSHSFDIASQTDEAHRT